MDTQIQFLANLVTVIGFPLALIALYITKQQLIQTRNVEEARFWLELREKFKVHDRIHRSVRGNPTWVRSTIEDDEDIDAYLGQFELCQSMLEKRILDPKIFAEQYAYRIVNLLNNNSVREYISYSPEDWKNFIQLCKDVKSDLVRKGLREDSDIYLSNFSSSFS